MEKFSILKIPNSWLLVYMTIVLIVFLFMMRDPQAEKESTNNTRIQWAINDLPVGAEILSSEIHDNDSVWIKFVYEERVFIYMRSSTGIAITQVR